MSRQSASGAFGLWSADSNDDDLWLDAFVTDFLTRARERNFAVPQPGVRPGARPAAQRSRQRARANQGQFRGARLCALCSRPQRAPGDRRFALSHRRQARRLQDAARQGAACGCAGHAWRSGARRQRCSARRLKLSTPSATRTSRGPTMAHACAMRRPCWRCSPRPISAARFRATRSRAPAPCSSRRERRARFSARRK